MLKKNTHTHTYKNIDYMGNFDSDKVQSYNEKKNSRRSFLEPRVSGNISCSI